MAFAALSVCHIYAIICGQCYLYLYINKNMSVSTKCFLAYTISYIGFMQVIRDDMTCLGFIFPLA